MRIGTQNYNNDKMFQPSLTQKNVSNTLPVTTSETSVFVSEGVDSDFAANAINQYAALAQNHDTVSRVIILSTPDTAQIDEIRELDDNTKQVVKDYINGKPHKHHVNAVAWGQQQPCVGLQPEAAHEDQKSL